MDRKKFHEILRRFVEGECTDEEKNLIDQWYELLDDEDMSDLLNDQEITNIKNRVLSNLREHRENQVALSGPVSKSRTSTLRLLRFSAAAAFVIAVFTIYWLVLRPSSDDSYALVSNGNYIEKQNTSGKPLVILLEDSSLVTLQSGSSIRFPAHFKEDKREVYMRGAAFFEVTKNPRRPFYVFNNSIVTHVIGTSFSVKYDKENNTIQVDVRTGRVEVLENSNLLKKRSGVARNGVILTPNQKVIYHQASGQFESFLTDKPQPLKTEDGKFPDEKNLVFEDASLATVLKALENQFGVEILVENEELLQEPFTGDISRQDLFTKLNIICQSLKICYETKGTKILITKNGCN